jgi:hypothetical protein
MCLWQVIRLIIQPTFIGLSPGNSATYFVYDATVPYNGLVIALENPIVESASVEAVLYLAH